MIKWILENKETFRQTVMDVFKNIEDATEAVSEAVSAILDLIEDPAREYDPEIKVSRGVISDFEKLGELRKRIEKLQSIIPYESESNEE